MTQFYTNKTNAARGAKRAGLIDFIVERDNDGRYFYVAVKHDDFEASAEELAQQTTRPIQDDELTTIEPVTPVAVAVKAVPAKPAKPAAKKLPGNLTKKGTVLAMAGGENGVTVAEIAEALGISPVAARALIGDLRNDGHTVRSVRGGKGEPTRFVA